MNAPLLRSLAAGFFCALALTAQTKPIEQGMEPDWDIRPVLKEISAHAGRLLPIINQADPKAWVAKGAPEAYQTQWASLKAQTQALQQDASALSQNPEKLSDALKVFFRMQAIENMVTSLNQAIRKYQNSAVADQLASVSAENGLNRNRFERYIVDLAADREQQFNIMNDEAQRCRSILIQQPVSRKKKTGRK